MPGRRPQAIRATARAQVTNLEDPKTSLAVDQVRAAAQAALDRPSVLPLTADLAIGTNTVKHGLGREPAWVGVTPTVADASFAWALNANNPHPDRQVLIDVVGVAQPRARLLLA